MHGETLKFIDAYYMVSIDLHRMTSRNLEFTVTYLVGELNRFYTKLIKYY